MLLLPLPLLNCLEILDLDGKISIIKRIAVRNCLIKSRGAVAGATYQTVENRCHFKVPNGDY